MQMAICVEVSNKKDQRDDDAAECEHRQLKNARKNPGDQRSSGEKNADRTFLHKGLLKILISLTGEICFYSC